MIYSAALFTLLALITTWRDLQRMLGGPVVVRRHGRLAVRWAILARSLAVAVMGLAGVTACLAESHGADGPLSFVGIVGCGTAMLTGMTNAIVFLLNRQDQAITTRRSTDPQDIRTRSAWR